MDRGTSPKWNDLVVDPEIVTMETNPVQEYLREQKLKKRVYKLFEDISINTRFVVDQSIEKYTDHMVKNCLGISDKKLKWFMLSMCATLKREVMGED